MDRLIVEAALLSSKEVLEKTGISRATLNNYISWGIVPRPVVLPPAPDDGAAPRIGYFPPGVVERIEEIQRLKREGWSIQRITEHFVANAAEAGAPKAPAREGARAKATTLPAVQAPAHVGGLPQLSFGEIAHPAYLVNNRFEVVWRNDEAHAPWPDFAALPANAVSHGVFEYLVQDERPSPAVSVPSRNAILRLHIGLARQRGALLDDLVRDLAPEDKPFIEGLYHEAEPFDFPTVVRVPVRADGRQDGLFLYALSFREGVLFMYVPGEDDPHGVQPLLQVRGAQGPVPAPTRGKAPVLTHVAVLVTALQDSARLWSELPPDEYFELVNQVWVTLEPILRAHHGVPGRHDGDGMACYFLPREDSSYLWNALAAAQQVRHAMGRISREWQTRKGWDTELWMNTGVSEGQEWQGTLRPGGAEFAVLGDAASHAARIAGIGRPGSIWATRGLVVKLAAGERQRLQYGIRRRGADGQELFVPAAFSRVQDLPDAPAAPDGSARIADLAITEVLDIAAADGRDNTK